MKDKIIWTFNLIEELQRVPETYLKHIDNTDGLFSGGKAVSFQVEKTTS
ncbi:MAG: hypothetical protein ABIJ40_00865 [Bacteroidota bacterium]